MPALGFLRRRRTRDGNPGPSPPATPTASSSAEQPTVPRSSPHSSAGSQPAHRVSATATQQPGKPAEAEPMNTLPVQQPPYPVAQHTPSPGSQPQNVPRISNLINAPQQQQPQDSSAGYQQQHSGGQYAPYPSNHGAAAATTSNQAQPQPQPQPQRQQDQQQAQQVQQAQQHYQPEQQQLAQQTVQAVQPVQQSEARVTRGRYSLADFEILRTLGTGSFGRVHLVQSRHNSRFYAIKVLKKAQVVKMKQVEHTNDERRMLGEVKHPFLITLWGTFQDAKNLYMVMDFVEGGELFSLLRRSGRFPNPVAKFYAAEVTLALEYLHARNIIYRDLKPENLLLDRHGHLKITDFGFAKRVPDKTWTLCGTPDYLAPEVVSNKGYNKSVDWWSLGILIYEMLCGYTPFYDSGSAMKIYENILRGKVKYPAYVNPDAQDLLERLITADLTKRLGNLYGGSQDVKNHPWFAEVTWDRLARKDIDAPYSPPVRAGAGDASQFDRYPEETEQYGQTGHDEYGYLFPDF
ncbi:c2586aac-5ab0-48af-958b-d64565c2e972 [Thermothielavioides terrestris]|uniref:cAMP-dependent protein kinase n=1 Tax=Thermothielavioides terrestris TaxID=2587410 RepID=A0A446BIR3_9PEZI|nr:c2586aac-5ab0-48af-958b-d64565c2e972 [Thermothielavioides terrestris]